MESANERVLAPPTTLRKKTKDAFARLGEPHGNSMIAIECMNTEELCGDETWWQIYKDSFPASQREPPDVILKSLRRGVGMAFRARLQGMTSGLATTHLLRDPAAVFIVYLAVARGERSRGIGGELLRSAWEAGAQRLRTQGLQPIGLIWEVDRPQFDSGEGDAPLRRIVFFERHGGELLKRPYLQPPLHGIVAVPMGLMFRPANGKGTPTPGIVEGLVRAIYLDKYEAINGIDRGILERLLKAS
jgi:GNAT superfamily N-acetyltransferase